MQFIRQFKRCLPDRRCCRQIDHGTHYYCCGFNVQSGHSADDGSADASTDYPCADDTASATNATSGTNQDGRTPATDS